MSTGGNYCESDGGLGASVFIDLHSYLKVLSVRIRLIVQCFFPQSRLTLFSWKYSLHLKTSSAAGARVCDDF
jgi:hypothetical protein